MKSRLQCLSALVCIAKIQLASNSNERLLIRILVILLKLEDFISISADLLGAEANKRYLPMQDGEIFETYADTSELKKLTQLNFKTDIREGLQKFINCHSESQTK